MLALETRIPGPLDIGAQFKRDMICLQLLYDSNNFLFLFLKKLIIEYVGSTYKKTDSMVNLENCY
jgi:hypothetical protein